MRRLTLLPALLLTALACDATTPMDTDTDPPTETGPAPMPQGVQIGSEGIVLDPACTLQTVAEDQSLDGFERTPAQLAADRLGSMHLLLGLASGDGAGTLDLTPTTYEVQRGTDCPNEVVIGLNGNLAALPNVAATPSGWAVFQSDNAAHLGLRASTWTGDANPTFDPDDFETVSLALEGDMGPGGLTGSLFFEGCNGANCATENYASLTTP